MELTNEQIKAISDEYNKWQANEYAGSDLASRQKMGQYYTPPELTTKMLSNFESLEGTILDPTAGAGHLLAGAIMAGADPNLVYANEPDTNIRNNVLIPRLTSLGVPLRNIGPYPSVVKKFGEFGKPIEWNEDKINDYISKNKDSDIAKFLDDARRNYKPTNEEINAYATEHNISKPSAKAELKTNYSPEFDEEDYLNKLRSKFATKTGIAGDATNPDASYNTFVDTDDEFLADPDNRALYDKVYNSIKEGKPEEAVETIIEERPEAAKEVEPVLSGMLGPNKAKEVTDGINKEAEQLTDNNPHNDEVRNDVIEHAIDNDFFANYAKTIGGNGVAEDTLKPVGSIYSTPKIDRADHLDYRNGKISKEEYKKQLENQLNQSNKALSKASQMMSDERNRVETEGGQFNRGHIGAYAFPAGSAKAVAEKKLAELDTDEFTDADAKYYANHTNFDDIEDDLTYGEDYTRETPNSIDWDNIKVYKPGEDSPDLVSGYRYDEEGNLVDDYGNEVSDYESIDTEGGVLLHRDEDFAGPDELPATIDQIKDEDFVGPDEQLTTINGGLPAEIPYESVYDTSDYNFDWDAVIETLPPDVQQELNELPEEDKEEISNLLHWRTKKLGNTPVSGSVVSSDAIDMDSSKGGIGGSSRNPVGNSMLGMSLRATNANVGQGMHIDSKMDSNASIASKAPIPPTINETTGTKIGGSNNNTPRSNGSVGSGAGLLFSKVGMLKSEKSAPDIPMLGHTSTADELNAPTVEDMVDDMKEGLIEALEARLNTNPEVAESLGFDHKYKHWSFNGITLDEMTIAQLNELTNRLENAE